METLELNMITLRAKIALKSLFYPQIPAKYDDKNSKNTGSWNTEWIIDSFNTLH